jgi:hypothetical protein
MQSDLEVLVDTEARLDRALADARAKAATLEQEAIDRVQQAAASRAAQLDAERIRIADAIEREMAVQIAELEQLAAEEIARFDTIRDERARALARHIAEQLIAFVEDAS